jgi:hypothetical protein
MKICLFLNWKRFSVFESKDDLQKLRSLKFERNPKFCSFKESSFFNCVLWHTFGVFISQKKNADIISQKTIKMTREDKLFWKPNMKLIKRWIRVFCRFSVQRIQKMLWGCSCQMSVWIDKRDSPTDTNSQWFFTWLWIFSNSKTLQKDYLWSWKRFIVREKITGCRYLSKKIFIKPY